MENVKVSLTNEEKAAVKEVWVQMLVNKQSWGTAFYERLFEVYPHMKALFKGEISQQGQKLVNVLTLIVSKMDKIDHIREEVKSLAHRHVKYQVKPDYYLPFINLLLHVLEEKMGEKWTPLTDQAMRKVMFIVMEAVIQQMSPAENYSDVVREAMQALKVAS